MGRDAISESTILGDAMRSNFKGLTLIEVLIIVVMVGILLTLAFQKIRSRGAVDVEGALKADIEVVKAAEAKFFGAHNAYGSRVQLDSVGVLTPAAGNILTITATATGYTASATNASDPARPRTCSIEVTGGEAGAATAKTTCN